jgi:Protein of unknown function (DUF2490)
MRLLLFVLVFLLPLQLTASLQGRHDFQVWLYSGFKTSLNDHVSATLEAECRSGDDAQTLFFYYVQSRLPVRVCSWLTLALGYRQAWFRPNGDTPWVPWYNPLFDIQASYQVGCWKFSYRNRTQLILPRGFDEIWQNRNRIQVKYFWEWENVRAAPLISNELFLRQRRGFGENRFGAGGQVEFYRQLKFELLYVQRSIEFFQSWRYDNVIWFSADLKI